MKKLNRAVFILLAVSLVTVLTAGCSVQSGALSDRSSESSSTDTDRGPGSSSTDTDRSSENPSTDTDRNPEGSPSDAGRGSKSASAASQDESGASSSDADSKQTRPSKPFTPAGIPEASGSVVEENDSVTIDYSNTVDGYVMVDFFADTEKSLKVQVTGPSTTYTYNLGAGEWTTFPLSDGDGNYKVTVYEGMGNNKYITVLSTTFQVALGSEFSPFLHANQYVDYCDAQDTMAKTAELMGETTDTLERVGLVYDYVVKNVEYDTQKAATVQSGYLPVLDEVLASRKGICFDYAALMAAMLRSSEIPCKLVVGYSGDAYHAWVSVWSEESGWLDDVIFFDGKSWQRMDPTFASSNNGNSAVMQYIGDGDNYTPMYQY